MSPHRARRLERTGGPERMAAFQRRFGRRAGRPACRSRDCV